MPSKKFIKVFTDASTYSREIYGYQFASKFFDGLPKQQFFDHEKLEIIYDRKREITDKAGLLMDDFYNDRYPSHNIIRLLHDLREVLDQTAHYFLPTGEDCFYKDRTSRLESLGVSDYYTRLINSERDLSINSRSVLLQDNLIDKLKDYMHASHHLLIFASQGDFHERNICTTGSMIDVGAAGWHSLAGHSATFLWYTIFAAEFLAIKYHRSAFSNRKHYLKKCMPPLQKHTGDFIFTISPRRTPFINDYFLYLMNPCLQTYPDDKFNKHIHYCIAFRMLTVFNFGNMEEDDKLFCIIIAQLFVSEGDKNNDIQNTLRTYFNVGD